MVWPALIGAGGAILGGLLNKPKVTSSRTNTRGGIMGQAQGAREAAEKYGFNPLTLLGASSTIGPSQSAGYMGSAIADASLLLADGLSKQKKRVGKESQLEAQNRKLSEQVKNLTLRPKVGGIYAQRQSVPSTRAALGRSDNASVVATPPVVGQSTGDTPDTGGPFGLTPNSIAPGRDVDVMTLPNSPGVFEVENSLTGGSVTIPGDSEPWGIDELLTAAIVGGPQVVYNHGGLVRDRQNIGRENRRGSPVYRMEDGQLYAPRPAPPRSAPPPTLHSRYPYWHGRPGTVPHW